MEILKPYKMNPNFFIKNTRGQTTWPLKEIAVMVLVAVLVIATFGFFNKLWAAVSQEDGDSTANFEELYNNIKELVETSSIQDYRVINYFIGQDYILVGFDTYWNNEKKITEGNIFGLIGSYNFYKPYKCGNAGCICLYTKDYKPGDSAKRDEGVMSCRSEVFVNKNVVFLSEGSDITPKTSGVNRGDNGNYLIFDGKEWKIQPIYIEKYSEGGKIYIYISKIDTKDDKDPANIRKKKIDNSKKVT